MVIQYSPRYMWTYTMSLRTLLDGHWRTFRTCRLPTLLGKSGKHWWNNLLQSTLRTTIYTWTDLNIFVSCVALARLCFAAICFSSFDKVSLSKYVASSLATTARVLDFALAMRWSNLRRFPTWSWRTEFYVAELQYVARDVPFVLQRCHSVVISDVDCVRVRVSVFVDPLFYVIGVFATLSYFLMGFSLCVSVAAAVLNRRSLYRHAFYSLDSFKERPCI